MSDVGKVDSSKLGPVPSGPRRKKGSDAEKFKEIMKEGKVRETDPEQQRQRKRQAESEEEAAAQQVVGGGQPPPGEPVEEQPETPFELQLGREAMTMGEPTSFEPEEAPSPAPPPPMYQPPPPVEEAYYPVSEPTLEGPQRPSYPRAAEERRPTEQQQPTAPQRKEAVKKAPAAKKPEKGKKAAHPPAHPTAPAKKEKVGPLKAETKKIETEEPAPYTPTAPPYRAKLEKKEEEELSLEGEEEGVPPPTQPLAQGAWEATESLEKEEEKPTKKGTPLKPEAPVPGIGTFQPPTGTLPSAPLGEAPIAPLAAPFAHLPPQIAAIFERMVGVMTVMTSSGINETTLNLTNPQFEGSAFFGAQIIITEYSTAPKAFNIQFLGNDRGVTLFANNAQDLVAAFQAGDYNFKVNRIDTGYLPPAPEIRKREATKVKRKKAS